ncbi:MULTISPECIES: pyrroloquinoline quinone biosynthesis protein PqqB [Prauserella salsuginis group]|uniref:Coenzyme PQQ synthesis protein B n=1 Tax=Prauserella salsuginis TaxID=387889 RepID=A0ABW6GC11_9PSEU|nr:MULTISPECIES: pyrroloquinoline quinone biosynthesis protein PqqB [Prauserella salsuginis group]MCR3718045.1 pyrroloquinoline quinone biosynthesis protein B [Prauserella flava]MCR3732622.1 pyrroloquinoline quinone biosynthesis protein B [Prauserella salsuginis]
MFIHCLGAAAGGGYPQWNCACEGCRKARAKPELATKHAGIAVSGDGDRWFLLNATPDVHHQIAADPALHPGPGVRDTPVAGVLLTDAEFDHTIGLLMLREGSSLTVYGTYPVLEALRGNFPIRELLGDYAELSWSLVGIGEPIALDDRLRATAFVTGSKAPRYVGESPSRGPSDWEVGYRLEDTVTGGTAVYAPTLPRWDESFAEEVESADCVFVDGTFWTDDEMSCRGAGGRTGRSMGHMPVSGDDGSARRLAALPARRKIYTHINNTNPVLDEDSTERRWLTDLGIEVGRAGLEVEV